MNNKVKNVIITILAVLVLGLGGYLVYEKMLSNDNSEVVENNQEQKEENYDLALAEELINDYVLDELERTIFSVGYNENIMRVVAIKNIKAKDIKHVNCNSLYSTISNDFSDRYAIISDLGTTAFCDVNGNAIRITYETLSNIYKQLFGNDKNLEKKDFNYLGSTYDYNESVNSFIVLDRVFGVGGVDEIIVHGIKKAIKIENKLIINLGVSILENSIENDWITTIDGEQIIFNSEVFEENFEQQFLNQYLSKLDTYKFTFFEEDGIYKLESMVKE